jgi:hypothetical protein
MERMPEERMSEERMSEERMSEEQLLLSLERRMPNEVLLLIVEHVPSAEALLALRKVSDLWSDRVNASLLNWVRRLPLGRKFASCTEAGLWVLRKTRGGRKSL